MTETRGLGKGIRSLIPEQPLALTQNQKKEEGLKIPISAIRLNRFQPRKRVEESKIQELANSIQESGLIYPLLVRKIGQSGLDKPEYELIAGERRLKALRLLGETEVAVIVKEIPDQKALELSLVENIQREPLNPVEEALAFQRLASGFELTHEEIAAAMGKDRTTVTNTLRLLKLAPPAIEELTQGRISLGHARALLAAESPSLQTQLALRTAAEGLSVREVERRVREASSSSRKSRASKTLDPHLSSAQQRLRRALGTHVEIVQGRSGKGWVRIAYYSLKDLDRLLAKLVQ